MKVPQMLLIAGNGRNSGKTTVACRIIRKFSTTETIIAMKISPHLPNAEEDGKILFRGEHLYIAEETNTGTDKDSSRMLASGANRSFFMVADEGHLQEAVRQIFEIAGHNTFLVCESGGLRKWVEPGLFLMVSRMGEINMKAATRELMKFEHTWITFDGSGFSFDINRIVLDDNSWKTEPDHENI